MSRLSSYISKVSRNLYMEDVLQAIEKRLDITKIDVSKIETSIILKSTSEEIELWEEWLELDNVSSLTLQDRIDRVVYTLNFLGMFTKDHLKQQALLFTNGEIQINESFEDYHFEIEFTSVIGIPPNLDNFSNMVNINKPAHLTWSFKFRYRTHGELKTYTHQTLRNYTHAELKEKGEIL